MSTPVRSAPRATVATPPIEAPAAGLTSLANFPDKPDERWLAGYTYRTEYPTVARNRSQNTATVGVDVIANRGPALVDTIPVALTVVDELSAFNYQLEDLRARAERIMEAYTSRLLERELWTGEIAAQDGLPNRVLAASDAVDVTPGTLPSPQVAVALLIGALADAGGGDGMVHVTRSVGIRMPDAWKNEETAQSHGFVIVNGAGYPGTGPDGTGTNWLYATGTVNVRLGDVEIVPDELSQAIRTSDNTLTYYAQRFAAADFTGPVFACQVSPT